MIGVGFRGSPKVSVELHPCSTFFHCQVTSASATVVSQTGSIAVRMDFTGHSHDCDCDTQGRNSIDIYRNLSV